MTIGPSWTAVREAREFLRGCFGPMRVVDVGVVKHACWEASVVEVGDGVANGFV